MQQQITASALFGSGNVAPMAISPYGVGLGMESQSAPVAVTPAGAVSSSGPAGMAFLPDFIPGDFWSSSGFGLLLLVAALMYFDVRLLNVQ